MKELDKVLDANEKILWEGAPSFWPFLLSRSLVVTIFGIFWMMFILLFFVLSSEAPGFFRYFIFLTPHFWIGIGMVFGPTLYSILVFKHTYYAITDRRVIFQKGWIGRDFDTIDFDQVTNAQVEVGVFDKIFGQDTGSVLVSSAGTLVSTKQGMAQKPYVMSNVSHPYDVFKMFKKVSYDVKTDIHYPNQLRPEENKGYETQYDPNKK